MHVVKKREGCNTTKELVTPVKEEDRAICKRSNVASETQRAHWKGCAPTNLLFTAKLLNRKQDISVLCAKEQLRKQLGDWTWE